MSKTKQNEEIEDIEDIQEEIEESNDVQDAKKEEVKSKVEKSNPELKSFMEEMRSEMDSLKKENKELKEQLIGSDENYTEENAKDILARLKGKHTLTLRVLEDEKRGKCFLIGFDQKYGNKETVDEKGNEEIIAMGIFFDEKLEKFKKEVSLNKIFDLPKTTFEILETKREDDPVILGTTPVVEYKPHTSNMSESGQHYSRVDTGEEVYNVVMKEKITFVIKAFGENVEIDSQAINF